jgi:small-conductance mechanosensitive channel
MATFSSGIYSVAVLMFLFNALLILAFFRLVKYLIPYMRLTSSQSEFVNKNLPVAELAAWIIFLVWAMQYMVVRGYLLTLFPVLVFTIIILYLAWYGLKDLIAGVVFRSSYSLNINDHISVMGIAGKITAISPTRIELEDHSGQIISIPYGKMAGNVVLRQYPSQTILSHHFMFEVPQTESPEDVFVIMEKLRITILALPWASQKKAPKITVEEQHTDHLILGITIFSIDESYFTRMEKILENEIGDGW